MDKTKQRSYARIIAAQQLHLERRNLDKQRTNNQKRITKPINTSNK